MGLCFCFGGLCLQARRLVEKQDRGIFNMRGRRSLETEREAALISDAALSLSMHASNLSLAREFGIAAAQCKISLEILKKYSLPCAPLAVNWPEVIQENWLLADQRYPKAPDAPRSFLVICRNYTYTYIYIYNHIHIIYIYTYCSIIYSLIYIDHNIY